MTIMGVFLTLGSPTCSIRQRWLLALMLISLTRQSRVGGFRRSEEFRRPSSFVDRQSMAPRYSHSGAACVYVFRHARFPLPVSPL
jgi:hypothetical protein